MPNAEQPLAPGGTIGILGGGQLGRMLALAAARIGLKSHIYAPDGDCPAAQVTDTMTCAAYEDAAALRRFAATVDVVTYEFENVPTAADTVLADTVPVYPDAHALAVAQDRLTEKTFMRDLGIATAPFAEVGSLDDLHRAIASIGCPCILKTRRFGYDGKGQVRIDTPAQTAEAWAGVASAPSIVEGVVAFDSEISVIVARGLDGTVLAYDPARNAHDNHILSTSTVPSGYPDALENEARALADQIVTALGYVGVMGVELFVCGGGGQLMVNEIAPRVHNSGHWTLEACVTSQFEQHMRAVAGWPLGTVARHSNARMTNLIGADVNRWHSLAATPGAAVHLYGKGTPRPGRKMGHVTQLAPRKET